MAHINLLPWREELRAERQKVFGMHAGITVGAALITVIAVNAQISRIIDQQHERNDFLKQQIVKVEAEIKEIDSLQDEKERLLKRTEVIEQLQQTRAITVHLFDELVNATPPGVFLLSFVQKGEQLEIKGVAESSGAVSDFMRRIEAAQYLGNPALVIIENRDQGRQKRREFTLRATVKSPKPPSASDAAGKPAGGKGA